MKKNMIHFGFFFLLSVFSSIVSATDLATYQRAIDAWDSVLNRYVDDQGRTDFVELAKNTTSLKTYIDFVEQVSPDTHPQLFPSKDAILAYHINTYNALAMYGVIERGIPKDFGNFFKRASFFKFRKIVIGQKKTSLYDYENKVIRPLDEPRAHFALNCMVKDCPRLPQQAFVEKTLDETLESLTFEFFSKDKHFRVNEENKTVHVSAILDFYTKDFVTTGKSDDLLQYINPYLNKPISETYQVKFIDYDWTINQQP